MGMDTFRRRSHRTHHEHRADALAVLLVRILQQYRDDIEVHDCDSCIVNVGIFEREARDLGVDVK
jgi:hypothetical protein